MSGLRSICFRWFSKRGRADRSYNEELYPLANSLPKSKPSIVDAGSFSTERSTSTDVPASTSCSFHSYCSIACQTSVAPQFIVLLADEVGRLKEFILQNTSVEWNGYFPEQDVPIFLGELWRWAQEAAESYWEKHDWIQSLAPMEETDEEQAPYEQVMKEAKEHYQNVMLFEYNILGDNDPSWTEEAWEHPSVAAFMDALPVSVDKACLLGRIQHVYALAVALHRLRQDSLDGLPIPLESQDGVPDIDLVISNLRNEKTALRRYVRQLAYPQSLLELQRQQWLSTVSAVTSEFKMLEAAGEDDSVYEPILQTVVGHLAAMRIEDSSRDALFHKLENRFATDVFDGDDIQGRAEIICTFPSRVMFEFARDLGKAYCELEENKEFVEETSLASLLRRPDSILSELEDFVFERNNQPILRYYYAHVMGLSMETLDSADATFLADNLINNKILGKVVAVGIALEIMRLREGIGAQTQALLDSGASSADLELALLCRAVSEKPFDVGAVSCF